MTEINTQDQSALRIALARTTGVYTQPTGVGEIRERESPTWCCAYCGGLRIGQTCDGCGASRIAAQSLRRQQGWLAVEDADGTTYHVPRLD